MNHQQLLNQFREELANLSRQVELSVAMGFYDINKICENVLCGVFKEIYGFKYLRNLNSEEKKNFPGIDLADDEARVAVQVTSEKTLDKIKDSLTTIIKHNLHKKYDRVIFYILTVKQRSYRQASIDKVTNGEIEFNISRDILDKTDLARMASKAEPQNLQRAVKILVAYMQGSADGLAEKNFVPLSEAENRLQKYRKKFCLTYREGAALVPFACRLDGKTISSDDVTERICERGGGLTLKGPSGCGKSMLAEAASVAYSETGGTAIIVQGKEFTGSIEEVIDRETTLLGAQSAMQLLEDALQLKSPLLLIVDGYNECAENLRGQFTREVAALADRFEAGVLVTSQIQPDRTELLGLMDVNVQTPTKEIKFAIAEGVSDGKVGPAAIKDLLDAVSTGLEAKLVGEVGAEATINLGSSRYALFNAFARKRLSEAASDGIRVLSKVADWLSTRFAFSLSIRDFDRLMDEDSVSSELRKLLVDSGMLTIKGDRVSFPHEMFLDAFAAEAVVRQAGDDPNLILKAIKSPLHAARKSLIIGAIEDSLMLDSLLPRLEDYTSIRACLQGECGNHAQAWAEAYYRKLWGPLREEAANVCFEVEVIRNHFINVNVGFARASLKEWTRCNRAFIALLPELMVRGQYLEEAMDIVRIMDSRIEEESLRLCREKRIEKTELQSRLFATSYAVSQDLANATGMAKICADITSGVFKFRDGITEQSDEPGDMSVWLDLMGQELSPGQLYLFLELYRNRNIISASFIRREIESRWNAAPYHLRLVLVESVPLVHEAGDDTERVKLIKVIEELENNDPFLSLSIIEALQMLGALDEDADEHQTTVLENIRNCLSRPEDGQYQTEAWRIYTSQFEHPYSSAYYEAVASLSISERKGLLDMALRGVDEAGFWLGALLLELAELTSFGDHDVGENIGRWTKPPPTDNRIMPQKGIEVFIYAHIALAKLRCSLPNNQYSDEVPSVRVLRACGTILYWSNREDIDKEKRSEANRHALSVLVQHEKGAALDALRKCDMASTEGFKLLPGDVPVVSSIVTLHPSEAVEISRDALSEHLTQAGYHDGMADFAREEILTFGIRILERHGNKSDCSLLRNYASGQKYGKCAIAALRAIEERASKSG